VLALVFATVEMLHDVRLVTIWTVNLALPFNQRQTILRDQPEGVVRSFHFERRSEPRRGEAFVITEVIN
jgi:hypothetical protein